VRLFEHRFPILIPSNFDAVCFNLTVEPLLERGHVLEQGPGLHLPRAGPLLEYVGPGFGAAVLEDVPGERERQFLVPFFAS
jgi:hypothetical protein